MPVLSEPPLSLLAVILSARDQPATQGRMITIHASKLSGHEGARFIYFYAVAQYTSDITKSALGHNQHIRLNEFSHRPDRVGIKMPFGRDTAQFSQIGCPSLRKNFNNVRRPKNRDGSLYGSHYLGGIGPHPMPRSH